MRGSPFTSIYDVIETSLMNNLVTTLAHESIMPGYVPAMTARYWFWDDATLEDVSCGGQGPVPSLLAYVDQRLAVIALVVKSKKMARKGLCTSKPNKTEGTNEPFSIVCYRIFH
jgi:Cu/Ag efflux protein CusF